MTVILYIGGYFIMLNIVDNTYKFPTIGNDNNVL